MDYDAGAEIKGSHCVTREKVNPPIEIKIMRSDLSKCLPVVDLFFRQTNMYFPMYNSVDEI